MAEETRISYKTFSDNVIKGSPKIDPLLAAIITGKECSNFDEESPGFDVRTDATIIYKRGKARPGRWYVKFGNEMQKIGVSLKGFNEKGDRLHVKLPSNLETLYNLAEDENVKRIEFKRPSCGLRR